MTSNCILFYVSVGEVEHVRIKQKVLHVAIMYCQEGCVVMVQMLVSSSHKELVNKAILTSNPPAQLQIKGIDQTAMLELQSEIKGIFKTHVILMMDTCDRLLDSCFLVQGKLKIGKKNQDKRGHHYMPMICLLFPCLIFVILNFIATSKKKSNQGQ